MEGSGRNFAVVARVSKFTIVSSSYTLEWVQLMRSASFGLFLLLGLVACVSGWTASSYRAGVVEYMPFVPQRFNVSHEVALAIMHRNINEYEKFMIEARAEGVDILVFPEYGLYGPSFPTRASVYPFLESIPSAGANPCLEHDLYPYLNVTYRYVSWKIWTKGI